MSRGNRDVAIGNLSTSMRNNYNEHGVSEYYKKVGSTYRNPHYPGIRLCLLAWLNKWMRAESSVIESLDSLNIFDMACGPGEVTMAITEWYTTGKASFQFQSNRNEEERSRVRRSRGPVPLPLGPQFPQPQIVAADPYTSEAYQARTSLSCSALSFRDVANGALPGFHMADTKQDAGGSEHPPLEMVICSFALHLIDNPSELFALLWELSTKARWLIVLAPHKKPEIKDGWGWAKWNIEAWSSCAMMEHSGELTFDRVHCRVYRSLNL